MKIRRFKNLFLTLYIVSNIITHLINKQKPKYMKINKEKFTKILFYFLITLSFLTSTFSYAGFNTDSWSKVCDDKKNCVSGIVFNTTNEETKKTSTYLTAEIIKSTSTKKEMVLMNEADQTYKVTEKKSDVTILSIKFPFNVDLTRNALVGVEDLKSDDWKVLKLKYLYCNPSVGCKAIVLLDEESVNSFKAGRFLKIQFSVYSNKQAYDLKLPLKGFSKAYKKL